MGEQANNPHKPPNLLEKAALIPRACIFCVFESSEAQQCCLPISRAPLAPTNPHPPLASNFLSGKAEPSPSSVGQPGLSKQALAGCTLEERRVSPFAAVEPAAAQRRNAGSACRQLCAACSCAPGQAGTRRTNVLSIKLHAPDWGSGIFFSCQP